MFKGTINVVMGIVTSRIVADPLIVGMHVGRVGMSGLIDKSPVSLCDGLLGALWFLGPGRRLALRLDSGRGRTMGGYVSRTGCAIATTTLPAFPALRQSGDHRYRHHE